MTTTQVASSSTAPTTVGTPKSATLDKSLIDLSPNNRGRGQIRQQIRLWGGWALRAGVPILLIVFWQLTVSWGGISEDVLPSPKTIVEAYSYLHLIIVAGILLFAAARERAGSGALAGEVEEVSRAPRPQAACVHRRDVDEDQHGANPRMGSERAEASRSSSSWPLEDHDISCRSQGRSRRCALRLRWSDQW